MPTVEEKTDFEQFRASFEAEHQPVGPTEQVLVEDIVISRWHLNRIRKMEPGFFAKGLQNRKKVREELYSNLDGPAHLVDVLNHDGFEYDTYGKMSRYEGRFERTFYRALKELQRLQALRAAVPDSGIGTVSHSPISPDPDPPPQPEPAPPPPTAQASARGPEPAPPPTVQASPRGPEPSDPGSATLKDGPS